MFLTAHCVQTNVKFGQDRYLNQVDKLKGTRTSSAGNKGSTKDKPVDGNKRAGSPLQNCKSKVANTGVGRLNTPALSARK